MRVRATIAILTFNGQEFLDEVLHACLTQETTLPYEVLVLDSGSTDRTLDIVAHHPGVRLHRIPNGEFGHGKTRNLAASLADGEIVVFLTQDATPIGSGWLGELLAPFGGDPRLAGIFSRQVPRPGCGPTTSREVIDVFRAPPPGFFSNVCSAVRRSALLEVPFRDVAYAEDQAFAADATAAGWHIEYCSAAAVYHSHDLALGEYFRRMYDEARGLSSLGRTPRTDLLWLAGATVRGTALDWLLVARHAEYRGVTKLAWTVKVPAYNVARRVAIFLAGRRLPAGMERIVSLDARRRQPSVNV